jgi:hypothetical protein
LVLYRCGRRSVSLFQIFPTPGTGKTIAFVEDLYDTFYGAREFGIRDLNGYVLYFIQRVAA